MPTFLFSYRAPADYQVGDPEMAERWRAWFQSLGSSVTTLGNPATDSAEVGHCGAGTRLGGYSVITADDREAALAMAKSCPAVDAGAGVEVGLIVEVSEGVREAQSA